MKRLIKFGSVGLVIAGAIASVGEVLAQVPDIFLFVDSKDNQLIGVSGVPFTTKKVDLVDANVYSKKKATIRVNACGFAKISNPLGLTDSNLKVLTNDFTFNVLTVLGYNTITEPTCVNGVRVGGSSLLDAWSVGKGAIVVTGLPPSRVLDVEYDALTQISKTVNINACGYGTLPNNGGRVSIDGAFPVPQFNFRQAKYTCTNGKLFMKVLEDVFTKQLSYPYVEDVMKDPSNNLIFKDNPNTSINVSFGNSASIRSATTDRCGGLYIGSATSPAPSTVKINGAEIDIAALPLQAIPERCAFNSASGLYGNVEGYGSARLPDGRAYVKPTGGYGDRAILSVESTTAKVVAVKTNACGLAVIKNVVTAPITPTTAFTYKGVSNTVAPLTSLNAIPKCDSVLSRLTFQMTP